MARKKFHLFACDCFVGSEDIPVPCPEGAARSDRRAAWKSFLKQIGCLAGYWISYENYENIFCENAGESGVQAISAIANASGRGHPQRRGVACCREKAWRGYDSRRRRVSVEPGQRKSGPVDFTTFAWRGFGRTQRAGASGLGRKRKIIRLIKCTNSFQFIMQLFCVQRRFMRRISQQRSPACHDRRATVRGVHA